MNDKPSLTSKIKTWLYDESTATRRLKVAAVTMQCDTEPGKNLAKITQNIDTIMQQHPDVNLILFGEMILGHYKPGANPAYHREISESIPGDATRILGDQAKQQDIYICFGMSENNEGPLHNTQVLLNPEGEIQACHRKWNLKAGEIHAGYQPSDSPVTFTTIQGINTGLITCFDAAHPRTIRTLMQSHPQLILYSLADDEDEDWFMAKALARLYSAWIVSANRFGQEQNFWNGHTVISDPLGKLRATSVDREGYLVFNLGFAEDETFVKHLIRHLWVKVPLLLYVLTHLKTLLSYYK